MCLPVLCLCLSVDAETGPFTLSLIESCQTSTGGTQSLHACSAGKHSSGCWQVKAQEQKIISVLFLTARVYSSASQNYWLESKVVTSSQNFDSEFWLGKNRVKISTRNSKSKFRIGTFESELLSRNFRVEISSRKFQLEIQTRNFRLEILTRNSDLKFKLGTSDLKFWLEIPTWNSKSEPSESESSDSQMKRPLVPWLALAVENIVVFIFLLCHSPGH